MLTTAAALVVGLLSAVVAAAVVADDKPAAGQDAPPLAYAWTVALPQGEAQPATFASWLTGDAVARVQRDGIAASRLADGATAWTLGTPQAAPMCSASATTDGPLGVIVYGTPSCDRLGVVDVRTGGLLREAKLPAGTAPAVAVAGGTAVLLTPDGLAGYGLADGEQRWLVRPGDCPFGRALATSQAYVFAEQDCGDRHVLVRVAVGGGAVSWKVDVPDGRAVTAYVSAEPAVVLTDGARLLVLDDQGRIAQQLSADELDTRPRAVVPGGLDRYPMLARGTVLYARRLGSGVLVALDLATGRRLWQASEFGRQFPIRADDASVWVLGLGDDDRLLRFDRASGAATVVKAGTLALNSVASTADIYETAGSVVLVPYPGADTTVNRAVYGLR